MKLFIISIMAVLASFGASASPGTLDTSAFNEVINDNLQNEKDIRKNIQSSAGIDTEYTVTGPSVLVDQDMREELTEDVLVNFDQKPSRSLKKAKRKFKETKRVRISEELSDI